nr:MAG TPA: tail completion protein [Caudoviricetes sp.]
MLKGKDLKRGIISTIHENFKEKVLNSEAMQGFKEPYFFVYFESFERESYSNTNDRMEYGVVVQYEKADRNTLMEIGDKLSELFNYSIKIQNYHLLITNNAWTIEENSLFFTFDLGFYVDKKQNEIDYKLMESLIVEVEGGNEWQN